MTSYFEISGHIVECSTDGNTSLPSSLSMVTAADRPERGRNSAKSEWGVTPETAAHRPRGRHEIHREIQRYAIDMWTIPIRHGKASDIIAPIGAGYRNFRLSMERNYEFYEYLSER